MENEIKQEYFHVSFYPDMKSPISSGKTYSATDLLDALKQYVSDSETPDINHVIIAHKSDIRVMRRD